MLVKKIIVSVVISDTTVCASLDFCLHYTPGISHFLSLFLSSFPQYLGK